MSAAQMTGPTMHREGAQPMPMPEMKPVAEGDLPTGEHWVLRAGGDAEDYYSFLETIHPDGHRDEGGMGGPPLYPGQHLNTYTGGNDRGLRRVIVRADPAVQRLLMELDTGEHQELEPVGADQQFGVVFFAALLPWASCPVSLKGLDHQGHALTEDRPRRVPPPPEWPT